MSEFFQIPYEEFSKRNKHALNCVDPRSAQKLKEKIEDMIKKHVCLQDSTNYNQLAGFRLNNTIHNTIHNTRESEKDYGRWQKYQALIDPKQKHVQDRGPHQNNQNNQHFKRHNFQRSQNGNHFFRRNNNYRYNENHAIVDIRKRPKIGEGDEFHREILSLLNKISPQNFERIKHKILCLCDNEDKTELIIFHILKKAHKDFSFVKLYMSLLYSIPPNFTYLIHKSSNTLLNTFLKSLPQIIQELTKNIEGENNLSKFMKAKKEIYDINRTLCTLMIFGFINDTDPIMYLHTIKELFNDLCQDNHEIYDIFIHFLYDFFSIHTSIAIKSASQQMITNLFEQKHEGICSKKTDFKWMDLLKFFQPLM